MPLLDRSFLLADYDDRTGCACRGGGTFGGEGAENQYPPHLELEPVHLEITLKIDIEAATAAGAVVHTVTANKSGARTLVLDAIDFQDVQVRGAGGHTVQSVYDGRKLTVTWDKELSRGERRDLEVSYRVVRPVTGLSDIQASVLADVSTTA